MIKFTPSPLLSTRQLKKRNRLPGESRKPDLDTGCRIESGMTEFVYLIIGLIILFLLCGKVLYAEDSFTIDIITITGNDKTDREVFITELGFKEGDTVSRQRIEEGVNNIQLTNLFSNVEYTLTSTGSGKAKLLIKIEEKWTTIPIFKVTSGGGVSRMTLGVYDPNILGKNLEVGFQYERLESTDSGVAWFKKPRLFGTKNGIDVQVWKQKRLRTKYHQDEDDPVIKTGFLHSRDKFYLGYQREFSSSFASALFYEYNSDTFSDELSSEEVKEITDIIGLPDATDVHFIGTGIRVGRVNDYDASNVEGKQFSMFIRYGFADTEGIDNFWDTQLSFYYYQRIFRESTFAQRFQSGFTTTKILQYWNYLGGLEHIRGFAEDRFAGRYFWLSNSEYRQPLHKKDWYILQAVAFVDVVSVGENFDNLGNISGASAGIGIRFVLPKIYRFVIRVDYAESLIKNDKEHFSFGVQQFF